MNLIEKITEAVEVVAAGAPAEGSLREQAEAHLGTEIDDECASAITRMANTIHEMVFANCMEKGFEPMIALHEGRAGILIAGMAIGKRLGAEEGEKFGRVTAELEKRNVV